MMSLTGECLVTIRFLYELEVEKKSQKQEEKRKQFPQVLDHRQVVCVILLC